jgi:RHS repeat-associated protein
MEKDIIAELERITGMDGVLYSPEDLAVYGYDGEGRRMKKTVGSETTFYFYGVSGLLCEFTTANTGATAAGSTDRITYRTSEKLGSAVLIMSAAGTVIENNRTLPYGEAWLPEVASTNDKKFTTYQRDQESGLDYAMNRFYGNTNGRFNSPDKAAPEAWMPLTLNRYLYTIADPINHTDPDGNFIAKRQFPEPLPPIGPAFTWRNPFIYLIRERQEQEGEARYLRNYTRTFKKVGEAMTLLIDKQFSPDCEKFLAGYGLRIDAMKERFLTTALSTGENTYMWQTFKPEQRESQKRIYGSKTVAEWMTETKRDAAAVMLGNEIFFNIGGGIARYDDATNAGIYMHELAHNLRGDDYQIPSPGEMTENCVKK